MLYDKDKELIKKLQDNANDKYNCFTQGDIEHIIDTIKRHSILADRIRQIRDTSLDYIDITKA